MVLAGYMAEFTDLKEVWLIISPHNPLKKKETLLADYHRLQLVKLAIGDNTKLKASDVEFKLPQPSYTIHTLAHLEEKHPQNEFVLIMGTDNLESLPKWKNYERILENHSIYVYPRPGSDGGELKNHPKVKITDAPLMEISASFIRKAIKAKRDVRYMIPEETYKYILEMHFYEK